MLFILLFAILFILCFLLYKPKNIFSLIFSLDILAICMLLIANIIYPLRLSQYNYTYRFELFIYNQFRKIPLSVFETRTLVNIAIFVFIVTSVILMEHDIWHKKSPRLSLAVSILYLSLTGYLFLYVNAPNTVEKLYLYKYSAQAATHNALILAIQFLNILAIASCFMPCLKLLNQITHSRIFFKKRHLNMLFALHGIFMSIFLCILLFTPVRSLFNNFDLYDFSTVTMNNTILNTYLDFAIILLFLIMFFMVLLNFNVLNERVFNVRPKLQNDAIFLATDICHIFHSYKNAMFSIKLLAEKAISSPDNNQTRMALDNILQNADTFLSKVTHFLDIYNNMNLNFDTVNVIDCVDAACAQISLPSNVTIVKSYEEENLTFYGDYDLMKEAFVNILSNAVESVEKTKRPDGKIQITIWSETPWLCIDLWDNGTGVEKKLRKKIFRPLFSTKKTMNNWGIGLSYVKNIVQAHSGHIDLRSQKNKYAEFQIALLLDTVSKL